MLPLFICCSKTLTLSFLKFLLTWTKKTNPAIWPGLMEALCDKNRLIFYLNFSHIQQQQKRYSHIELHFCRSSSRLDVKFVEVDFILKVSQSPITANSGNQTTIFTKKIKMLKSFLRSVGKLRSILFIFFPSRKIQRSRWQQDTNLTWIAVITWQGLRRKITCLVANLKPISIPNTRQCTTKRSLLPTPLPSLYAGKSSGTETFPNIFQNTKIVKSSYTTVSTTLCPRGKNSAHSLPPFPGKVKSTPPYKTSVTYFTSIILINLIKESLIVAKNYLTLSIYTFIINLGQKNRRSLLV